MKQEKNQKMHLHLYQQIVIGNYVLEETALKPADSPYINDIQKINQIIDSYMQRQFENGEQINPLVQEYNRGRTVCQRKTESQRLKAIEKEVEESDLEKEIKNEPIVLEAPFDHPRPFSPIYRQSA